MLEFALTALLLAAALLPVGVVLLRARGAFAAGLLYAVAFTGAALILSARGGFRTPETPPRPVEDRFDGYVSSDACKACHLREYETWKASYHHTMTQVPTPESVLGDFDDVHLEHDGIRYVLSRKDGRFWVEWEDPEWTPQDPGPRTIRRQLVLMTGSHHDQMYWYALPGHGDALQILPFDYSRRLGRWIPAVSSFLQPPDRPGATFIGQWNATCSTCHSVRPDVTWKDWEPPYINARMESRVAEFGIACEACHGPGKRHIEENHNPLRRYREYVQGKGDSTIVQPATLDPHRSAEVCGQCHGVFLAGSDTARFVPGMDISNVRVYVQTRYADPGYRPRDERDRERQQAILAVAGTSMHFETLYWGDGQVRVSGREYTGMLESPCFERGDMACVSCHTMHQVKDDPRPVKEWANDQVTVGMGGNRACVQCHPAYTGAKLTDHTRHLAESSGSLCYNCHMPWTVYGIQKAHRSHTVSSPSVRESVQLGRPNACNQCHLDQNLAWTGKYLRQWYDMPESLCADDGSPVSAGVRWALSGDAGQRALTAWSMGWDAARAASGGMGERDWMVPYLGQLLDDPYDSVRFVALLALRKHRGFDGFDYDFMGPPGERREAARRVRERGERDRNLAGIDGASVLLDADGTLQRGEFERLLGRRDDTPVRLLE